MGFLLFAARKLQIKRELNSKNYELMLVTDQYNQAAKKVSLFQQSMSNLKQATSAMTSTLADNNVAKAFAQMFGANSDQYEAVKSGDLSSLSQEDLKKASAAGQLASLATNQLAATVEAVSNSVFDTVNKAKLAQLQSQQQSLDLKKESIESEVSLLSGEYDKVKQAEGQAVKSAAPEFGLA